MLWMPVSLQYLWLAHQLYATIAMYVYRFADGHAVGTTAQKIAERFQDCAAKGEKQKVYFGGGEGVLMAELEITYHNRVRDGHSHLQRLLFGELGQDHQTSSQTMRKDSSSSMSSQAQSAGSLTPSMTDKMTQEQVRRR